MSKTLLSAAFLFFLSTATALAQTNPRYLVLFKDKSNTIYSLDKPAEFLSQRSIDRRKKQNIPIAEQDFPVNAGYLSAIGQTGAKVIYPTKWFNGALVEASPAQLESIKKLSFYKGIELNLPVANMQSPGIARTGAVQRKMEVSEDINYGSMNAQLALMNVPDFHAQGYKGENMLIAILDNGFIEADKVAYFQQIRDEKRVIDTHDFLYRNADVYDSGTHGLRVMSTIGAYLPGTLVGSAFKASFALYHTENDYGESPYEEVTWLLAAERADSLGADIISSSLGYTTFDDEFSTPAYNHTYSQMDGKTTIVSRAARYATRKGVLVVNSAGNEGNNGWRYITAPADVDSVLTVGATNYDRSYAAFSSMGPNAAGVQKPDVSAVGSGAIVGNLTGGASSDYGTSFSAPQIAGVAAILWQAYPQLTAQQIIYVLKKSGHLASAPDNYLGYGVPDIIKAQEIVKDEFMPLGTENGVWNAVVLSPNPAREEIVITTPTALVGKEATLQIHALNGTALKTSRTRLQAKETLRVAELASGLYVVNIRVGEQEKALKFIKQ